VNFYITDREAREIGISVLAIAFAFAIANFGLGLLAAPSQAATIIAFFLATIGVGFIMHEMAHKVVANLFGAAAEFRMWTYGLMIMLVLSITGFIFAAPGAVYIYSPYLTRRQNGLISLAGPLTNLALVGVFLALALFAPISVPGLEGNAWIWGVLINLMLGFFNMLPMFPLDGSKIIAWNFLIWLFFVGLFFAFGIMLFGFGIVMSWGLMLAIALIFSKALSGRF